MKTLGTLLIVAVMVVGLAITATVILKDASLPLVGSSLTDSTPVKVGASADEEGTSEAVRAQVAGQPMSLSLYEEKQHSGDQSDFHGPPSAPLENRFPPTMEVYSAEVSDETIRAVCENRYLNPGGVDPSHQERESLRKMLEETSRELEMAGNEQGRVFRELVQEKLVRGQYVVNTGQPMCLEDYPGAVGVSSKITDDGVGVYVLVFDGESPEFDHIRQLPLEIKARADVELCEFFREQP